MHILLQRLLIATFFIAMADVVAEPIRVTDASGQVVELSQPATRIVALAPHIVENLYSAGAGDKIVGTVDYADFPKSAQRIPRIGRAQGYSLESILALKPDLIIAWYTGNGADLISKLKKLSIPVYFDEPSTLPKIAQSITHFGVLAGTQVQANKAVNRFHSDWLQLQKNYQDKPTLSVFFALGATPLRTLSGKSVVTDVINLCGGRNVFDGLPQVAPLVSIESVVAISPQVILAGGGEQEQVELRQNWAQWQTVAAVKGQTLYTVNADWIFRHTKRVLLGAQAVCEHLEKARQSD